MEQATSPTKNPQVRSRRFTPQPEIFERRQITDKSLMALATIERYRFIPTSLLLRLVPGGQRNTARHLQTLYHRGFTNRFALPKYGGPGEFIYYLDRADSLATIIEAGLLNVTDEGKRNRLEVIRNNRENDYAGLHRDIEAQGKVLFIQHELMISRFHGVLELACRHPKIAGKVLLEQWKQGTDLWNEVETPVLVQDEETGRWLQTRNTEKLPHRPDAFFTLYFPTRPEGKQRSNFFYEADRSRENTTRYKEKMRAHFHFVVEKRLHRTTPCYNVPAIRAVLTESINSQWANNLREAAKHPTVSKNPSPLFWFTTSEHFTGLSGSGQPREIPPWLREPETVFKRIWHTATDDSPFSLLD